MTSRLEQVFDGLKARGRTGLVTYVTAGDPDIPCSMDVLRALDAAGADVLEVGVPFSDPLADGPVIQRASERALRSGATLSSRSKMTASASDSIALATFFSLSAGTNSQLRGGGRSLTPATSGSARFG